MLRRLAPAALLAVALVAGCGSTTFFNHESTTTIGSGPYVQGSGTIITQARALDAFHAIAVENGLYVTVVDGAAPSVDVTADDNLVGMITTTVEQGTLHISVEGSLTTHNGLRVRVIVPAALDAIDVNGGSTVDSEHLTGDSLAVTVNGGSTLRAGGKLADLRVSVDGGSTADLQNVEVATAEAEVNAGSTARLNVSASVTGRCSAGSTLKVSGGASIDQVESDTGSTVTRD
jgi:hypothetical protein